MITIRPATSSDQSALGPMGAALMRQHHAADPRRFLLTDKPEAGYGRFLVSQLADAGTLVMVAEDAGEVVGYVFASIEGTSWRDLRGPCGFIHDVLVLEGVRQQGAGRMLVRAAIDWIHSKGMSQVVLWRMTQNVAAQSLFGSFGFRQTMTEMTLDQDGAPPQG